MLIDECLQECPKLAIKALILAACLAKKINIDEVMSIYFSLLTIPITTLDKLHKAIYDWLPFKPEDYGEVYSYISYNKDNPGKLKMLMHSNLVDNRFTANVKFMIQESCERLSFERFERGLGILWTSSMLNDTVGEGVVSDTFYMPLALSLSQNPNALLKLIKSSLSKSDKPEDIIDNNSEPVDKEIARTEPETKASMWAKDRKVVHIKKEGIKAESLFTYPKEEFLEIIRKQQ